MLFLNTLNSRVIPKVSKMVFLALLDLTLWPFLQSARFFEKVKTIKLHQVITNNFKDINIIRPQQLLYNFLFTFAELRI